jgi:hypothetical protein
MFSYLARVCKQERAKRAENHFNGVVASSSGERQRRLTIGSAQEKARAISPAVSEESKIYAPAITGSTP